MAYGTCHKKLYKIRRILRKFRADSVRIPHGIRAANLGVTVLFPRNVCNLSAERLLPFRGTSSLSADRLCPYPRNVNASAVTRFVLVRICTLRGLSQAFPQTITFNNEQQRLNVHTRGARLSPANQICIILFTFWSA